MRGFGDSRLTTSTGCCIALKCGSHESKTLLLVVLLKPELALPRPRKETSDSPTPPVVQNANDPHPTALLPGFESSYGKKRIRVSAGTPSSKPHDGLDVAKGALPKRNPERPASLALPSRRIRNSIDAESSSRSHWLDGGVCVATPPRKHRPRERTPDASKILRLVTRRPLD
ncbi:hypothetical protein HZH68_001385 [Vespula germanica]|uniref:Uncharacterized protein n=1 Tax=Vespula germanica TaxID=30212 RepID=A0A834NVE5_VESGE|nr:hypothetical protein HZH68_001385 [Vespula germanica]